MQVWAKTANVICFDRLEGISDGSVDADHGRHGQRVFSAVIIGNQRNYSRGIDERVNVRSTRGGNETGKKESSVLTRGHCKTAGVCYQCSTDPHKGIPAPPSV